MTDFVQFNDPFLQKLKNDERSKLESRRLLWNIEKIAFYTTLDSWFSNFDKKDKKLALKIVFNISYYSQSRFKSCIQNLWISVERYLTETETERKDVLLVVPDDRGDSADRHAYDMIKEVGLQRDQIIPISKVEKLATPSTILIFFNDTHGTGNQFISEFSKSLKSDHFKAIFILGVSFSQKALRRFHYELPEVKVIPGDFPLSAAQIFNGEEWQRIKQLGKKIYPNHPVGYGDAALMTAYYFQCPNNSLPIIWANGQNNTVKDTAFPWRPLFSYQPKRKTKTDALANEAVEPKIKVNQILTDAGLVFTEEQTNSMERWLIKSDLLNKTFLQRLIKWFENFEDKHKKFASDLLTSIEYQNIDKVRSNIRSLKTQVVSHLQKRGSEKEDILIITTGYNKNSVYHYVFEFLKEWGLEVNQVCDISELTPDKAIDKSLVFFYHTRSSGNELFNPLDGNKSYWDIAIESKPANIFILSYATTPKFQSDFELKRNEVCQQSLITNLSNITPNFSPSSLSKKLPSYESNYSEIIKGFKTEPSLDENTDEHLSVSYYFQTPKKTCPLIWYNGFRENGKQWFPLFKHIEHL